MTKLAITKEELVKHLGDFANMDTIDVNHLMDLAQDNVDFGRISNTKESILNFISMII